MVNLLDCVKRIPSIIEKILDNKEETFKELFDTLGDKLKDIDEIVFVGSGTSNNSALTSRYFVELASGLRTTVVYPNEYLFDLSARNPKALYVFTSQSGTSIVVRDVLSYVQEHGFVTAVISESSETMMAKDADIFIDMGCGEEEFPIRNIGYTSGVLTQMLMGMEIGLRRGYLSQVEYDDFLSDAHKLPANYERMIRKAYDWVDKIKAAVIRSQCIIFTGAGSLYGVALEGALKTWEIPQMISVGYELEEGIHGPNFGYNHNHCVIVLNDGRRENKKAVSLAKYMKQIHNNGYIVGMNIEDPVDFSFTPKTNEFACLEFIAVLQVLVCKIGEEIGIDLENPRDNTKMNRYFIAHSDFRNH